MTSRMHRSQQFGVEVRDPYCMSLHVQLLFFKKMYRCVSCRNFYLCLSVGNRQFDRKERRLRGSEYFKFFYTLVAYPVTKCEIYFVEISYGPSSLFLQFLHLIQPRESANALGLSRCPRKSGISKETLQLLFKDLLGVKNTVGLWHFLLAGLGLE